MKTKLFILLAMLVFGFAASAEVIWRDGSSASNVNYDNSNDYVYGSRPTNLYSTADEALYESQSDGEDGSSSGGRSYGLGDTPNENPGNANQDPLPVTDALPCLSVLAIAFILFKSRKKIATIISHRN